MPVSASGLMWCKLRNRPPEKNVSVGQNQVMADDLILAGQKVNVQCEAKQDLIVAGDEVTITGPINGYILAAGNHLMLSGLHCPGVIFRSTVVDGRIGVVVGRRLVV